MAWVEQIGSGYRVRYRHQGRMICDSTHADEQVAQARCQVLEAGLKRRRRLSEPGPVPTLDEWVQMWSASRLVGLAAFKRDESMLRVHLLPRFGAWRLSAIDLLSVQAFVNELRQDLAYESVRSILLLLRKIVRDAVAMQLLPFDPTAGVRLPDQPHMQRAVPDQRQVIAIAERMPTLRLKVMVISAAATGMRWRHHHVTNRHQ